MVEVPEVMPEKDYLNTIAEEVLGLIEVLERPPKVSDGRSLDWHGRRVVNPKGLIFSEDKYFLYEFSSSYDSGIKGHIDGLLYTKDPGGNLREIITATTHLDKPPFPIAWPKFMPERRAKWVSALKEVGGEFGFYYGDREIDVRMLPESFTDSVSLEKMVDAYCKRVIEQSKS